MTDGHGANYRYVSRKRRTKEDGRFITGRGKFVADVALPGLKHVAMVSSPHPRANIRSIDTEAALAVPGAGARRLILGKTDRAPRVLAASAAPRAPKPGRRRSAVLRRD